MGLSMPTNALAWPRLPGSMKFNSPYLTADRSQYQPSKRLSANTWRGNPLNGNSGAREQRLLPSKALRYLFITR